jgi:hypothetical protein
VNRRNFLLALPAIAASGSLTTKIVDEVFEPQAKHQGSLAPQGPPPSRVIIGTEPYDPANNYRDVKEAVGLLAYTSYVHAGLPLKPIGDSKLLCVGGPWQCSIQVESLIGPETLMRRLIFTNTPGVEPVTYVLLDRGAQCWDGTWFSDLRVVLTSPRIVLSAMTVQYGGNQLLRGARITGARAIFFDATNSNACLFDTATAHGPHWSPTGLSTSDEMDEAWDKQFPARYEYFALRRLQLGALAPIATV